MAERGREVIPVEPSPEELYETSEDVPEFYIDSMHFQTNLYTSTLYLGELKQGKKPILRVKVKVSPHMLKAIALLLGKQIRAYEEGVGPVSLPKQLLHEWGLEEEL